MRQTKRRQAQAEIIKELSKELNEIISDPLMEPSKLLQAQRMQEILNRGAIGTSLITQLVVDSEVVKEAKPLLSAIAASLEAVMSRPEEEATDQDKVSWSYAALLAAYELGKIKNFGITNIHSRPN